MEIDRGQPAPGEQDAAEGAGGGEHGEPAVSIDTLPAEVDPRRRAQSADGAHSGSW
jgi:hypothetical protein